MALLVANWQMVAGVVVIALLAVWLLTRRPKVRIRHHAPDALDEGVGPAPRNQALIDAPSAAARVAAPLASTQLTISSSTITARRTIWAGICGNAMA